MWEKYEWKTIKLWGVLIIGFFFFLGMMLIDYGASFKCQEECKYICTGECLEFRVSSLASKGLEPRIVYHIGVLLVIVSFLILAGVVYNEIVKRPVWL